MSSLALPGAAGVRGAWADAHHSRRRGAAGVRGGVAAADRRRAPPAVSCGPPPRGGGGASRPAPTPPLGGGNGVGLPKGMGGSSHLAPAMPPSTSGARPVPSSPAKSEALGREGGISPRPCAAPRPHPGPAPPRPGGFPITLAGRASPRPGGGPGGGGAGVFGPAYHPPSKSGGGRFPDVICSGVVLNAALFARGASGGGGGGGRGKREGQGRSAASWHPPQLFLSSRPAHDAAFFATQPPIYDV